MNLIFLFVFFTCVFVKVELNLIATIEVLDVIKGPCGYVVSAKGYCHRAPWGSCHCCRDHEQ